MKKSLLISVLLFTVAASYAASPALPDALQKEARAAIDKGLAWLVANQKEGGFWSDERNPAMTALPVWAISAAGVTTYSSQVDRAVAYILSNA